MQSKVLLIRKFKIKNYKSCYLKILFQKNNYMLIYYIC